MILSNVDELASWLLCWVCCWYAAADDVEEAGGWRSSFATGAGSSRGVLLLPTPVVVVVGVLPAETY